MARRSFHTWESPRFPEYREEGWWGKRTTGPLSCQSSEQITRPRLESWCDLHLAEGIKRKVFLMAGTNMGGADRIKMEMPGSLGLIVGTPHAESLDLKEIFWEGNMGNQRL